MLDARAPSRLRRVELLSPPILGRIASCASLVFNRPTSKDLHLLMKAIDSPMIPALADAVPALGIESLQKMGAKFLLCANALAIWCLELEARGKGKASDIEKELRANLLPGVTIVPAMVIAIAQAQEAGIKYNRQ